MTQRDHTQSGFTLIEILMALAISGMLLAAVATAFNASIMNYEDNQEVYEALSRARQSMTRMTTQLRTATNVFSDNFTPGTHLCEFFDDSNPAKLYTFEYRSNDNKLVLIDEGTDKEYDLCQNVTHLEFTKTPMSPLIEGSDPDDAQSVSISMTVQVGDRTQNLTSTVAVRRKLPY